jgi:hypothetical protein
MVSLGICCRNLSIEICSANKQVFHTIANFPRLAPLHNMHVAFQILYIYDCMTRICRKQSEVNQNHENENVCK